MSDPTYQNRQLTPSINIKDDFENINLNSGEIATDFVDIFNQVANIIAGGASAGVSIYDITTSGIDTYTGTFGGLALVDGLHITADVSTNINTGAATFNLNGGGAVDIKKNDGAGDLIPLTGGELSGKNIMVYRSASSAYELIVSSNIINLISNKNGLYNSDYKIDQDQDGVIYSNPPANSYTLDGWEAVSFIDTNFSVQQISALKDGYQNAMRVEVSSAAGAGAATDMTQNIEDYKNYSNKEVTFSIEAKYDSGTTGSIFIVANGGTVVDTLNITGNGQLTKYSLTVQLPNLTTGLDIRQRLFREGLSIGQGATYQIAKLEKGKISSKHETKSFINDLLECLRYYWNILYKSSGSSSIFAQGQAISATTARILFDFPITMRISPTLITRGNMRLFDATGVSTLSVTSITAFSNTNKNYVINAIVATGLVAGNSAQLARNSDVSATVIFNARI